MERPKNRDHGDWATNIALQLSKQAGMNPRQFAEILKARLEKIDGVAKVDIAGPGFLNITARRRCRRRAGQDHRRSRRVLRHAPRRSAGTRINLEFVSANPTGPIHLGGTRWAAVGDALARVFRVPGRRGHPRVLLQRPRRADRPLCPLAAGLRQGRAGSGGRLRRRVHRRHRQRACSRTEPGHPRTARRRGAGTLPRASAWTSCSPTSRNRCTTSAWTSTSTSTRTRCTKTAQVDKLLEQLKGSGTCTRRTAPGG